MLFFIFSIKLVLSAPKLLFCSHISFGSHNSTKMISKTTLDALIKIVHSGMKDELILISLRSIILQYESLHREKFDQSSGGSSRGHGRSGRGHGGSSRGHGRGRGRDRNQNTGSDYTSVEPAGGQMSDEEQNKNVLSLFKDGEKIPGASICKKYLDTFCVSLKYPTKQLGNYLKGLGLEAFFPNEGQKNVSYRLPTDDAGEAQEASTVVEASAEASDGALDEVPSNVVVL